MGGTSKTLSQWVGEDEERLFQAVCEDCGRNLGRHVAWRDEYRILQIDDYRSATGGHRTALDYRFPEDRRPILEQADPSKALGKGRRTKGLIWGSATELVDERTDGYLYRYCPCNLRQHRDVKRRGDKIGKLMVTFPDFDARIPLHKRGPLPQVSF